MTDYKISDLSSRGIPALADLLPVVKVTDHSTPPAGAGGSDQKMTVADLFGAVSYVFPSGDTSGHDDRVAINTVIGGNGICKLIAGNYYIDQPLVPGGSTTAAAAIIGEVAGWGTDNDFYGTGTGVPAGTVIHAAGGFAGEAVILCDNESGDQYMAPAFRDFVIDCESMPPQTGGRNGHGIAMYGPWAAGTWERLMAFKAQGSCIVMLDALSAGGNPDNMILRAVKASGAKGTGSAGGFGMLLGHCPDIVVSDCEASECNQDAWFLVGVTNGLFSNCKGENSGGAGWHAAGFYSAGSYAIFNGCSSNENGQDGWLFDSSAVSNLSTYVLNGCKATNDGQAGAGYAGFRATGCASSVRTSGALALGASYGALYEDSSHAMRIDGEFSGSIAPWLDDGSNDTALLTPVTSANVPVLASADIARIFGSGHSYMAGFQNTEGGERYLTRLCAGLHAEEVAYAYTGGILGLDLASGNSGGYPNVLCGLTPRVFSGIVYTPRNSAPYFPVSPVTVFNWGFNDLGTLNSNITTGITWFQMAQRACICIARAGGWFPDTDGSVAYSSGWTANTSQQNFGWPTNHSATATTKTVTITVPADFPGGEICLYSLAKGGASGGGTKWSTVVDGGGAQVLDGTSSEWGAANTHTNLVVQRIMGLSAGAHAIVMTVTALDATATAVFQGWTVTAPSPPVVVLVNQPVGPGAPYTGSVHTPITSSDIAAMNAALVSLAAEFTDGNVIVADIATAFASAGGNVASGQPNSLYVSDGLHPNAAGHGLIAQVTRDAIRSAPLPGTARMCPEGILWRIIGGPNEPQFQSGFSTVSGGFSGFGKDRAGNGIIRAQWKCATAAEGNTIVTLDPGYGVFHQESFPIADWNAGFTAYTTGFVQLNQSVVTWISGNAVTEEDATFRWFADALGF